jgi:hypothetical protein
MSILHVQAKLPEQMLEPTPRFGPAAKAARAKEREEEAARAAKEKQAAATAAKAAAKLACGLNTSLLTLRALDVLEESLVAQNTESRAFS